MARTKIAEKSMRTCSVTGLERPETDFYRNQSHLKAVDNLRRSTGATKNQMARFYQALTN